MAELAIGEEATIAVTVKDCRVRPTRRRRLTILECRVADDTGPLKAVWFNQAYLADQLSPGVRLMLRGKLEGGRGGATFKVSAHELERGGENGSGRHTTGLVPVYPATEGLSARRIRELAFMVRGLEVHAPSRWGRACAWAPRWPGRRTRSRPRTGPSRSTRSRSPAAGWRSRSCSCSSLRS